MIIHHHTGPALALGPSSQLSRTQISEEQIRKYDRKRCIGTSAPADFMGKTHTHTRIDIHYTVEVMYKICA